VIPDEAGFSAPHRKFGAGFRPFLVNGSGIEQNVRLILVRIFPVVGKKEFGGWMGRVFARQSRQVRVEDCIAPMLWVLRWSLCQLPFQCVMTIAG
jgi:hypothetical protein